MTFKVNILSVREFIVKTNPLFADSLSIIITQCIQIYLSDMMQ